MSKVRQSWVVVLSLGLMGMVSSHALAGTERPDPTLVNPIGLGPSYTGSVRAGLGITHTETAYGIRLGEFVLQPRFFFENEFSSNFFKVDTRNTDTEETIAFTFHLRPGVGIHNPDGSQLKMNFMD